MLITWGDYIVASLPDPGDQLCTDDFEGESPHNVNLAAKVCNKVHVCRITVTIASMANRWPGDSYTVD